VHLFRESRGPDTSGGGKGNGGDGRNKKKKLKPITTPAKFGQHGQKGGGGRFTLGGTRKGGFEGGGEREEV